MKVKIIRALDDNYMYLVIDESTSQAIVVDPVEPKLVMQEVEKEGVHLKSILTTHHHWDHAGGNSEMAELIKGIKVLGGDANISSLTDKVTHGDVFSVGELRIECLLTPCHTRGHICYLVEDGCGGPPAVFTGDTLFSAGCGRFFEGTAEQMCEALLKVLGSLHNDTLVYCGHEYTLNNLLFAAHVEPQNSAIQRKLVSARKLKEEELPTVPSTIGEEKTFNPFMRVNDPDVQKHVGLTDPVAVMDALRNEKNHFAPRL